MRHLLNWALSALALWVVAQLVPGFHVSGPFAALIAALVIGFVNATLGLFLKIITFPLTVLTLGVFWLVINAAMIELASAIVKGFHVDTFGSAFIAGRHRQNRSAVIRTRRTNAAFSKRRAAVCRNACRSRHGCRPHDNWREHQTLEAFY
jgi:putative membrane protein